RWCARSSATGWSRWPTGSCPSPARRGTIPSMLVAAIVTLLIPLWIVLGLLVLLRSFARLARIDNGRYLRPLFAWMAKGPFLRKWLQKASQAAIDRTNPE